MQVTWDRYVSAMDLLIESERSGEAIAELKQKCDSVNGVSPFVSILYGLLSKSRIGVSECKRPPEGVTEEWLKDFMVRCNTYNQAMGALAMMLASQPEIEFRPPSVPSTLPSMGKQGKRRFKAKRR